MKKCPICAVDLGAPSSVLAHMRTERGGFVWRRAEPAHFDADESLVCDNANPFDVQDVVLTRCRSCDTLFIFEPPIAKVEGGVES